MPPPGFFRIPCRNLSTKIIPRCLEQFPHELCNISILHPCSTQPHLYLRSVKVFRLHFLKILHVRRILREAFCIIFCCAQLFPYIAGKIFVRRLPLFCHRVFKDYPGKFPCGFLLRFPA